jgi:hypothetical protein
MNSKLLSYKNRPPKLWIPQASNNLIVVKIKSNILTQISYMKVFKVKTYNL